MISTLKSKGITAKLWLPLHEVESSALDQIRNVCEVPGVTNVAVMPDVHAGVGSCVGTVIETKDIVMPGPVGVDLGCGMVAVRIHLHYDDIKDKLQEIHNNIKQRIPVGFNQHQSVHRDVKNTIWLWNGFDALRAPVKDFKGKAMAQIGTLGGGNHFIEMSIDQDYRIWLMLHSGSRHIGLQIANYYLKLAKSLEHNKSGLPDKSLAYFKRGTQEFDDYLSDLQWAQSYALQNRTRMVELIIQYLETLFGPEISEMMILCHHNYIEVSDTIITRKGAISAKDGVPAIIPGAMGAPSYIVKGKGNSEALYSAPHGAGRRMSRSAAKKQYTLGDLEKTMDNVVCSVSKHTVDEIKYSYKNIGKVIEYSKDLVEPIYRLEQILNIKG